MVDTARDIGVTPEDIAFDWERTAMGHQFDLQMRGVSTMSEERPDTEEQQDDAQETESHIEPEETNRKKRFAQGWGRNTDGGHLPAKDSLDV